MICRYFLPFNRLPFHFVDGFVCCAEASQFDVVPLVYFCFFCLCFWCQSQKSQPRLMSRTLPPIFFRCFMVSGLTLGTIKSLPHFELMLCVWCKIAVQFYSVAYGCPVFPSPFIEEIGLSPIVYSWLLCHKLIDHICVVSGLCVLFC